ncbi:AraC family transcriptional regulator [Roseibium sp. MMSF_3544]|uniref:AraC family transcriptional regulator n=1 Tax=unclassified Roseibium TaxID=2629323 RepID=UPI00273D5AB9|nr:AraC family transcriptional regulator [Roseibium sp. MMSF_3544]
MRLPQKIYRIENYIGATDAFHFVRKDLSVQPPVLEHCHDYFELMLIEQGQAYHWINGVEEQLTEGHLVFLRPLDSHALQAVPGTGARILNVMFRSETAEHLVTRYAEELSGRFFWQSGQLPVTLRLRGPQRERAVNSLLTLQTNHRSLTRIEHLLLSIMTHMLDAGEVIDDRAPSWLLEACRAVREPRVFRRGAAGFSEAAGRSQEHVCRQTRRYLGLSPTQYVNRIRIQHAAMLLSCTNTPLSVLALDCGFENLSYFHRLFLQQYGTTPHSYRLRHRRVMIDSH